MVTLVRLRLPPLAGLASCVDVVDDAADGAAALTPMTVGAVEAATGSAGTRAELRTALASSAAAALIGLPSAKALITNSDGLETNRAKLAAWVEEVTAGGQTHYATIAATVVQKRARR